ncbi:MAG: TonB-dependent receptor [Flammeovirgaceae bacterium]|nr:TonB-dependent receptor [Flammeovirgaceae bacterium]
MCSVNNIIKPANNIKCLCHEHNSFNTVIKSCCIIYILFFLSLNAKSQNPCDRSISGVVVNKETNDPLSDVLIRAITDPQVFGNRVLYNSSDKFSISDENGKFLLEDLCPEEDSLVFSRIGYQDLLISIEGDFWTVPLTERSVQLENVMISDEREKISGTQTMSRQSINLEDKVFDRTSSLASISSEIDGVTFISTGSNVERPVIHGLYGNRVMVLNNYIKHGFQNWGDDHAPEINIASVERISVIKGSSGVRFGPEALGGAIIVEPDPMDLRNPYYLNINSGYQTNGKGSNFNLKTGKGFENFAFNAGLSYIKLGDRHAPSYSLTNSGKEEIGLNLGLHYHLNNFDIKLYYSYVDVNLALLRSSIFHSGNAISRAINSEIPLFIRPFSYDINEPNQLVNHHLGKATVNWWYDENEKVSLTYGRQLNKRKEFDVRRNADRPIIDLDLTTTDLMLEWDHSFSERSDGLIGFHFFNQDNDNNPGTSTTPYIPNYNTNRYSFFLIENLNFGKKLFEIGARVDYEDYNVRGRDISQNIFRDEHSLNNVTFSIGYENQVSESFSFRSNIGSAWRTPNMAELYSFGSHGFKNSFGLLRYYYNEDQKLRTDEVIIMSESLLSSEKSLKFINEFDYNSDKNDIKLTLFSNYILNYVFERPIGLYGTIRGPMPYFIFDQSDMLFIGSDLTLKRKFTNKFNSSLTLNYLWSNNLDNKGKLLNLPPVRIENSINWDTNNFWKINSSEISLSPSYTFQQFQAPMTISPESLINGTNNITSDTDIFDFKDAPEGYFLLDFSWKFNIKDFTASVMVNNVLNKKYRNYLNSMRYFADEVGRNFMINLTYSFKNK